MRERCESGRWFGIRRILVGENWGRNCGVTRDCDTNQKTDSRESQIIPRIEHWLSMRHLNLFTAVNVEKGAAVFMAGIKRRALTLFGREAG